MVKTPRVDQVGAPNDQVSETSSAPSRESARRSRKPRFTFDDPFEDPVEDPTRIFVFNSAGARELHAALLHLALTVEAAKRKRELWISIPRMTISRVQFEWDRFLRIVDPKIAALISIVALTNEGVWAAPRTTITPAVESEARSLLMAGPLSLSQPAHRTTISAKFFDVWKVLLRAWLMGEGPITALEIRKRSASSMPTVAGALRYLRRRGEIADTRNQPIELLSFPRATLREILALSDNLRRPLHYHDASGRPPDPVSLLRQLVAASPRGVSIGGVVAARHYDPRLNLNGLPRVDVLEDHTAPSDWVRKLDPALRVIGPNAPSALLVVHPVRSRFANDAAKGELPLADPVETLLDLYEMHLTEQAEHLVANLRAGRPDA